MTKIVRSTNRRALRKTGRKEFKKRSVMFSKLKTLAKCLPSNHYAGLPKEMRIRFSYKKSEDFQFKSTYTAISTIFPMQWVAQWALPPNPSYFPTWMNQLLCIYSRMRIDKIHFSVNWTPNSYYNVIPALGDGITALATTVTSTFNCSMGILPASDVGQIGQGVISPNGSPGLALITGSSDNTFDNMMNGLATKKTKSSSGWHNNSTTFHRNIDFAKWFNRPTSPMIYMTEYYGVGQTFTGGPSNVVTPTLIEPSNTNNQQNTIPAHQMPALIGLFQMNSPLKIDPADTNKYNVNDTVSGVGTWDIDCVLYAQHMQQPNKYFQLVVNAPIQSQIMNLE